MGLEWFGMTQPLPEKLRPEKLTGFVGQKDLTGRDGIVRKLIKTEKKSGFFPSLIFWGPPGSGKTTLARIIANEIDREFFEFSAVSASVKDIQAIIPDNGKQGNLLETPIVFLDEIHRFNKAQQDRLLPHVEKGDIILIGATTENPSFEVINPLLSRSRVLTLDQLDAKNMSTIIKRGEKELDIKLSPKAKKFLTESAGGDARRILNTLEIAASLTTNSELHTTDIEVALQQRYLGFDKKGEEYYNVISAFIKSMRASDVNATVYYLARMIEAGQDPIYIARRMVVFASEDVGMAQPTALVVANEVFRACETIGYPECAINLSHGAIYLAKAKKDRRVYDALRSAQADVNKHGNLPVPMNIRNAPTKLMKELGYGKDYEMYPEEKNLLPKKIRKRNYFDK